MPCMSAPRVHISAPQTQPRVSCLEQTHTELVVGSQHSDVLLAIAQDDEYLF